MARFFTVDDVRRVSKETGAGFDEAVSLLEKTRGDVQAAVRLHRKAHSIYLEPEHVADVPHPAREKLKALWKNISGLRLNVFRNGRALAEIPLIIVMLAILACPPAAGGALLIMLFLGCRFGVDGQADSTAGCVVL